MSQRSFWVYIMASRSGVLYVGMTNDLVRRVYEHKATLSASFTSRYHITRLVFYAEFPDPGQAIEREKQIKGWRREKKIALIEDMNPEWHDLAENWREE